MSLFRSCYRALERHFFNTLFRKLLGCALPPVLLLAWLGWQAHGAAATLRAAAPDTAARLASLAFWLPLTALALAVGGLAAFHHSVTRPLEQLRRALASGDFSRELALESEDEIRHLGDAYNGFTRDLRTVLEAAKRLGLSIAIGATRTTRLTTDSARDAERQGDLSREITGTSESVASSTGQVALVTQAITAATQANLDDVRATRQELVEAEAGMALTRQRLEDF